MARKLAVPGAGQAKIINPWVAFLLALVTLGIYYVFWFGIRNLELNDYGESFATEKNPLHVNVFLAIVANTIGWVLIIPPFISQWRYYRRIGRAQELARMDHRISHVTGFLLYIVAFFLLPFEIPYGQHHLNRLWEHVAGEREKEAIGMRKTQPA
jgi:heme/copper-type cytochrome/quinol oxidase subunit 2